MSANDRYSIENCLANTFIEGTCLIWKGSTRGQMGYAQFSYKVGKGSRHGHREVFLYFKGEIPKNYDVGHICDKPRCINPEHLVLQTRKENLQQALSRGRLVSNLHMATTLPGTKEFSRRCSEGVKKYWASCSKEQRIFHGNSISVGKRKNHVG